MPSPSLRSSLIRWLDADAIIVATDGQPYAGNWGGFSQSDVEHQPIYKATSFIGQKACLNFNGSTYLVNESDSSLDAWANNGSSRSACFVFRITPDEFGGLTGYTTLLSKNGQANAPDFFMVNDGVPARLSDLAGGTCSLNQAYILQYIWNASTTTETLYLSGVQVATRTGSLPSFDPSP